MSRFYLSRKAISDIDGIRDYLAPIPEQYAAPIRKSLYELIHEIGANPLRGSIHSEASRLLGDVVRSRALPPYRLFYWDDRGTPEILAIINMAQDVSAILRERLQ